MGSREISRRRAKCGSWIELKSFCALLTEGRRRRRRNEEKTERRMRKKREEKRERQSRRRMEGALSNGRAVVSLSLFLSLLPTVSSPIDRVWLSYLAYTPKTRTEKPCLRRTLLFPPIPGLL
jgi:hypothetical protein